MTDKDIRKAIREKFNSGREFVVIDEVCVTTGYDNWKIPRRIDTLVINCFECNNFYIEGIEIKISKQDLKRELNDPKKHEVFFDSIDYYTIAMPMDLLKECKDMIPTEWGLLGVTDSGTARYIRKPKLISDESGFNSKTIKRGFFASVIRRVAQEKNSETYMKGYTDMNEIKVVDYYEVGDRVYPFDTVFELTFDIDVQEQNDKLLKIFPDGRQSSIMSIEDIYNGIQKGKWYGLRPMLTIYKDVRIPINKENIRKTKGPFIPSALLWERFYIMEAMKGDNSHE